MTVNKNREQRLRRALNKCGYALRKSRKAISPDNLGGYMIVDLQTTGVVDGSRFELNLDDIQAWLDA